MFLVMVSRKGGYTAHSAHSTVERAKEWAECLQHNGDDTAICELPKELLEDILEVKADGK